MDAGAREGEIYFLSEVATNGEARSYEGEERARERSRQRTGARESSRQHRQQLRGESAKRKKKRMHGGWWPAGSCAKAKPAKREAQIQHQKAEGAHERAKAKAKRERPSALLLFACCVGVLRGVLAGRAGRWRVAVAVAAVISGTWFLGAQNSNAFL